MVLTVILQLTSIAVQIFGMNCTTLINPVVKGQKHKNRVYTRESTHTATIGLLIFLSDVCVFYGVFLCDLWADKCVGLRDAGLWSDHLCL